MTLALQRTLLGAALAAAPFLAHAPPVAAQPSADPVARAAAAFERGDYAAARRVLEPYVQSHPRDARALYYLGWAVLRQGDPAAAAGWLERAVELRAGEAQYRVQLGNAYGRQAMRAGGIRRALLARSSRVQFEEALALDTASVDARLGLMRFYALAPGILGGDPARAREMAAQVHRRRPYHGANALVWVHRQQGNRPAVVSVYRDVIRAHPDSVAPYTLLANELLEAKEPAAALAVLHQLRRRRPGNASVHFMIGRLGALSGEFLDEAEASLVRYLAHTPAPNEPPLWAAHWRLGMIHERRGQRERALERYRASVALGPFIDEPRQALARLER